MLGCARSSSQGGEKVPERMADILVVLYVKNVSGITIPKYGVLIAIQLMTAILIYVPSAKIAGRVGRKPVVIATFFCFALYPITVILAHNFGGLILAFVVGGLREIGEPSQKAMIVDFAGQQLRGRTVGLYSLVRACRLDRHRQLAACFGESVLKFHS